MARQKVDLFASKTTLTAQFISRRTGTRWPTTGPTSSFMHSPRSPCFHRSSGVSGNRVNKVLLVAPLWRKPTLVVRADSATDSSPWPVPPETGSPLSGERNNMAPSTRAVGSLHLAAQREPTGLPERVLNPFSEARAPSTRRLYALKWSVFSTCASTVVKPLYL